MLASEDSAEETPSPSLPSRRRPKKTTGKPQPSELPRPVVELGDGRTSELRGLLAIVESLVAACLALVASADASPSEVARAKRVVAEMCQAATPESATLKPPLRRTLGQMIEAGREALDPPMTQTAFATAIGVGQQTVSKWESGKRLPRPQMLAEIARVLRISYADLLYAFESAGR